MSRYWILLWWFGGVLAVSASAVLAYRGASLIAVWFAGWIGLECAERFGRARERWDQERE